jgi:neurotensin receptor 2
VLSVASLSAERCLAVCQPLRARSLLTPRRTRRLLSLVWAASLGLALPMAVIMGQKHELQTAAGEPEPASRVCTVLVSRATLQVLIQVREWVFWESERTKAGLSQDPFSAHEDVEDVGGSSA